MVDINVTNYSRKRKSIEVPKTAIFPLVRQFPISTDLTLGINGNQLPQPFSFTSLLINGDGDEVPFINIEQQTNQIIEAQSENLRRTLADLYRNHYIAVKQAEEERAAKKIREKETELEKERRKSAELKERESHHRKEAKVWMVKVRRMEEEINSLREEALQEANVRGSGGKSISCAEGEDSSSSFGKAEEGVKVACARCGKRMATMMAWPCRHVSACVICDAVSRTCSVCLSPIIKSLEIILP